MSIVYMAGVSGFFCTFFLASCSRKQHEWKGEKSDFVEPNVNVIGDDKMPGTHCGFRFHERGLYCGPNNVYITKLIERKVDFPYQSRFHFVFNSKWHFFPFPSQNCGSQSFNRSFHWFHIIFMVNFLAWTHVPLP